MKGVSSESTNTDKMRAHALKAKVGDGMRHEDVDLFVCTDLVDQAQTTVLNGSSSHAGILEVLAANPDDKAMASDADPQLILKVVFKEKVNLTSVSVRFPKPPADDEETYAKPRLVKLFCNHEDLDFGDIEEIPPTLSVTVEDPDATEAKVTCIGHKFQRLSSVQILIEEAMDPEASRCYLNRVCITGHQAQSYHAEYR
eukprot:TRINITY_DN4500_c0_g2_i1.p1 TRINITY_DN4500_c0_g2~~TRINITY_DN4500_c0_g2_i1.p1  ORF type:complete len:199 (+),score=29.92 TRINITY_DN4500_c0_g2_i1:67-663(+)